MEIENLKTFVKLAECENMTIAAEEANVSQSTLSASISKLEKELGTRLFDRTGKHLKLNEDGKYFLACARKMIQMQEMTLQRIRESSKESGVLKIGVMIESDSLYFLLSDFQDQYPDIRIELNDERAILDDYQMSDLDFFVIPHNMTGDLPCVRVARQSGLFLLVKNSSPFASRESVHLDELKDQHFVFNARTNGQIEKVYSICKDYGFEPDIAYLCEGMDAKISLILNSDAVGITFNTMRHFRKSIYGLKTIPILPRQKEPEDIMLAWREEPLNPLSELLSNFAKTWQRDQRTLEPHPPVQQ
ncbi:MAG: LysR family transcriptional regulator [Solobacterium sp.]|nr:LysR family transcriptional regulator [Solobacterium sp.]